MATKLQGEAQTLEVTYCWCGIAYAAPTSLLRIHRQTKDHALYCPLGHAGVIRETEADRLKRELVTKENYITSLRANADQLEEDNRYLNRSLAGTRGAITRLKNRAKNGVCPCCNRTFVQLARHMVNKHPEYSILP